MSNEKTKLNLDCPERVAFDFMDKIALVEKNTLQSVSKEQQDRQYFLSLYFECLQTVYGTSPQ